MRTQLVISYPLFSYRHTPKPLLKHSQELPAARVTLEKLSGAPCRLGRWDKSPSAFLALVNVFPGIRGVNTWGLGEASPPTCSLHIKWLRWHAERRAVAERIGEGPCLSSTGLNILRCNYCIFPFVCFIQFLPSMKVIINDKKPKHLHFCHLSVKVCVEPWNIRLHIMPLWFGCYYWIRSLYNMIQKQQETKQATPNISRMTPLPSFLQIFRMTNKGETKQRSAMMAP